MIRPDVALQPGVPDATLELLVEYTVDDLSEDLSRLHDAQLEIARLVQTNLDYTAALYAKLCEPTQYDVGLLFCATLLLSLVCVATCHRREPIVVEAEPVEAKVDKV